MRRFPMLHSAEELIALVEEIGFLPFFRSAVPGFSVAELTPPELWFVEGVDGPWEWKGPVARTRGIAYGKLFDGKAGYVARRFYPDLANYRRNGYDFDARYDEGLASAKDRGVMEYLLAKGPTLSGEIRRAGNYRKGGNTGFETVITRLQMQTYVTVCDFVYHTDARGKTSGWGVAQYAAAEDWLGEDVCRGAYATDPDVSGKRIAEALCALLPDADERMIARLLGGR